MTAAEKLRMEIAQEAPFSKDEFISKISRLIKAYGYASFICDKHIRETDVSPNKCGIIKKFLAFLHQIFTRMIIRMNLQKT